MPNYAYFFRGAKPKNVEEGRARQPNWDAWFKSLGDRVVDAGAIARSLGIAGEAPNGSLVPTTGYAVIRVDSEEEAMALATTCPIYSEGGVVEVARHIDPASILAAR